MEPLEDPDDPRPEPSDYYRTAAAGVVFVAVTLALVLRGTDGLTALGLGLCATFTALGLLALASGRLLLVSGVLHGAPAREVGAVVAAGALAAVAAYLY
jgi:hypothetical protein